MDGSFPLSVLFKSEDLSWYPRPLCCSLDCCSYWAYLFVLRPAWAYNNMQAKGNGPSVGYVHPSSVEQGRKKAKSQKGKLLAGTFLLIFGSLFDSAFFQKRWIEAYFFSIGKWAEYKKNEKLLDLKTLLAFWALYLQASWKHEFLMLLSWHSTFWHRVLLSWTISRNQQSSFFVHCQVGMKQKKPRRWRDRVGKNDDAGQ